jgi:hypothetical protein
MAMQQTETERRKNTVVASCPMKIQIQGRIYYNNILFHFSLRLGENPSE